MDKGLKPTIGILATVPFIMVLGNSMLIPVLPAIRENLRLSLCQTGLLITAFSVPAGIVIPFAGILSDHWGRKKIMVPALLVYGTGGLLAGLAAILCKEAAYPWLLGARIIQGVGAGGTYQLAMALAGDLIQGKERIQVLGLLEAGNGLGKVVSPLAGAAVALLAWYAPFFVYGILAFPVALAVLLVAKEPPGRRRAPSAQAYCQSLKGIFQAKGVNLAFLFFTGMVVLFALFGLLSLVSDLLEKTYHYQVFHRGLVIAVPVLIMAVTSYLWGIILKRTPAKVLKWSLLGGLLLVAAGIFFFPVLPGLILKITATSLLGLGTGFALPALNTLVTSSVAGSERGLITCLYGTVRFFGVAVGPPVFGLPVAPKVLFWSIALLILTVLLLTALLVDPEKILPAAMAK
jgi:ACDE family multidrug resistance protein